MDPENPIKPLVHQESHSPKCTRGFRKSIETHKPSGTPKNFIHPSVPEGFKDLENPSGTPKILILKSAPEFLT